MLIETRLPLVEDILPAWKAVIGTEYQGYRNHVYRMIHCCLALHDCDAGARRKIMIAACFHDIGIWTAQTVDYIPPSIPPALDYLAAQGLEHWSEEIRLMISEHHKIRPFTDTRYPLVEVFRRGDLADFSLGLFRSAIPREDLRRIRQAFPNAGFHRFLARQAFRWFLRHPLNPAPMMKW